MSNTSIKTVGVTGANGFLGRALVRHLQATDANVVSYVRDAGDGISSGATREFDLGRPIDDGIFSDIQCLVHGAWDLRETNPRVAWERNVEGSKRLIESAMRAGVTKVIFVSSMSAYYGTRQSYGLMKLAVERTTLESGQVVVRPGLVYGGELGGMAQTLSRLARLPVIPVFRHAHQYTLHIDDYVESMANLVSSDDVAASIIGLANATSVTFSDIMAAMSTSAHGTGKMITVPWHVVLQLLRTAERLKIPLPVRSDSLLGLVQPAPFVPGVDVADRLHLSFREFAT